MTNALDLDWRLRLAAFDALRRITGPSGGVIARDQMTAGFELEGDRIPFALRARGIWKPARLGANGAALSITTASIRRGVTPRYDDSDGGRKPQAPVCQRRAAGLGGEGG